MKQINFLVIFAVTMALALFALQNPSTAKIQILPSFALETSIAIEIIGAMGIGAVLAWIFSVWSGVQRAIELGKKDQQIKTLQTQVNEFHAKIEEKQRLMTAGAIDVEVEEKTIG
ncbi:MAG: LapA family protein [Pseudanabaenaceae cyanobacterium bins.68]|nr:LapA family protein [Pseudanabaenaceae cyanobacterium bins.68]